MSLFDEDPMIKEAKGHGGLDTWFKKEKWVDLRRPKKNGKGYEPCGRGDTSKGKKPVCTPANKAKNINKKQRTQRLKEKAKKEREPNPDKKPNVTKYSPGAGGKSNVSNNYNITIRTSNYDNSEISPNDIIMPGEQKSFTSNPERIDNDFTSSNPQDIKYMRMADMAVTRAFEIAKEKGFYSLIINLMQKPYDSLSEDEKYDYQELFVYLTEEQINKGSLAGMVLFSKMGRLKINIFDVKSVFNLIKEHIES